MIMKSKYIVLATFFVTFYGFGQTVQVRKAISEKTDKMQTVQLNDVIQLEQIKDERSIQRKKGQLQQRVFNDSIKEKYYLKRIDEFGTPIFYTLFDTTGRSLSNINEVQANNETQTDLVGQNMIVGVLDGQVILDNHKEFVLANGQSRVVLRHQLPNLIGMSDVELKSFQKGRSHATHVGGIIAAEGKENRAKGVAPQAQLWSYTWRNDNISMASLANEGIVVSNHSYGLASMDENKNPLLPPYYFGVYTKDASMFDYIAYSYPYYQSVVAAGNDGEYWTKLNPTKGGTDLLLGTANAKNSIVVGAVRVLNFDVNQVELGTFSSVGPTNDYRIKPDIVAHGVGVFSSVYINPNSITASPNTVSYAELSGTSMATPLVSGIIALWQQWAIEHNKMPYRSATIRALITHTAKKVTGKDRPDYQFGYGVANANNGVQLLQKQEKKEAVLIEATLYENKKNTYIVEVTEDKPIVRFTLAWTDPQKAFSSSFFDEESKERMLVNDLDIKVKGEKGEYYPWKLVAKDGKPITEQGINYVDNLEQVEIFNASKGKYTIEITHKGNLQFKRQDYSLLISDERFGGINLIYSSTTTDSFKDFDIWPNPMKDYVNIEVPQEYTNSEIEVMIYNINGALVDKQRFNHMNSIVMPVQHLQVGSYILVVKGENWKKDYKLIKK